MGNSERPNDTDTPCPDTGLCVAVADLHIRYRLYEERPLNTRDLLHRRFRRRQSVEVHALRGVSFSVSPGDALGIVGPNGSGKSTLLRAIAGLQPKTSGDVQVAGEAHLLGVNAALNQQLSGTRNIVLGGLAMGLSYDEVMARMGEAVDFADIGDALSRPIITYSAGMRARLAFSIATLRVPDVLLIDEALAVGDKVFNERSLQRVKEIREEAHSVLMVSHNLREIRKTCNLALWLDNGEIIASGEANDVLDRYESSSSSPARPG